MPIAYTTLDQSEVVFTVCAPWMFPNQKKALALGVLAKPGAGREL